MHVRDCGFGGAGRGEEDVRCAAVRVEGAVHGHFDVLDRAVGGEDFLQMGREDVLGQLLDDNLEAGSVLASGGGGTIWAGGA